MGKLEKVGAAVVGVLLCIIVAVGVLNHGKTPKEDGFTEADLESKRKDTALRNDVPKSGAGNKNSAGKKGNTVDLDDLDRRRAAAKKKRETAKRKAAAKKKAENGKKGSAKPNSGNALANNKGATKVGPKKKATAPKGDWPKMYTVQDKDILGNICRKYYNSGRMLKQVLAANPGLDARKLIPGKTVIKLPAPDEKIIAGSSSKPMKAKLASKRKRPGFISTAYIQRHSGGKAIADKTPEKGYYIVRKNDSLSAIAKKQLGSIRHAEAIFKANRSLMKNRNSLRVGWKLKMPNVN